MDLKSSLLHRLLPPPVAAAGAQYSMIFSAHDDNSQPSEYLLSLALAAIAKAQGVDLADISAREKTPPYYLPLWPGEHYKLLAGLVLTLKPRVVIEIGTGAGLSALTMLKYLPPEGKLVTFDVIDWRTSNNTCLTASDFQSGKLSQCNDDLSNPAMVEKHRPLLESAPFIFIDAAKDGLMEQKFLDNFQALSFKSKPLLMLDDIRFWSMLKIWRDITKPKLDLTSFGHWSGTGLVEWKA